MKTKSELQETAEIRHYYLKNKHSKNEYDYFVIECFEYETKRGTVFPCQYSRKGRQWLRFFDKEKLLIHQKQNIHLHESSSARKEEIFKFLKPLLSLKDFECVLLQEGTLYK